MCCYLCFLWGWSDVSREENHRWVCLFRDIRNMLAPVKVVTNSVTQVLQTWWQASGCEWSNLAILLVMRSTSHLSALNDICHLFSHCWSLIRPSCSNEQSRLWWYCKLAVICKELCRWQYTIWHVVHISLEKRDQVQYPGGLQSWSLREMLWCLPSRRRSLVSLLRRNLQTSSVGFHELHFIVICGGGVYEAHGWWLRTFTIDIVSFE